MKRELIKLLTISVLLAVLFVRCDDDDAPSYEQKNIENVELLNVLKSKGVLTFEGDLLVMDDKVKELKELDLSGAKLKSLEGLDIFLNLERVNLSNNELGQSFDFSKLPANIKSIDLSDNKIYEFKGLAKVDVENAKVTVLRKFDKLVLPNTAKFNVETLPFYFKENAVADMQMQDKDGVIEKYTTLREIPDAKLREYMKTLFAKRFKDDKLDIASQFTLEEKTTRFNIGTEGGFWSPMELENVEFTTIEGVEYILNDPRFEGEFWALTAEGQKYTTNYIKLGEKCAVINMRLISTPILDLSNAKSLHAFATEFNEGIKKIDLSASKVMGQREEKSVATMFIGDDVNCSICINLEEILLPKNATVFSAIQFLGLPKLKSTIDLSAVKSFIELIIGNVPNATIKYPTVSEFKYSDPNSGIFVENPKDGRLKFNIDEDIYKREGTVDFINKNYSILGKNFETSAGDKSFKKYFSSMWTSREYEINGKKIPLYNWKKSLKK